MKELTKTESQVQIERLAVAVTTDYTELLEGMQRLVDAFDKATNGAEATQKALDALKQADEAVHEMYRHIIW